ncbi:hypothetical protein SAMN04489712_109163 [Thermomonospora echinospora]|uniref:Uncharacterized protein n=1 Tax=Thermomonospora echinospora TaxID=1992 RepID=A0A1H6CC57_9ACTN|nr:hypothetical protein [Thermomonospora echinospora]SEG70347.1 hypothetical protein SAMN04489712_109163 [Thermomonospora echinospora]
MADGESGEAVPGVQPSGARIAVALGASVVACWQLLVYGFGLVWYLPDITVRSECDPRETLGCGHEYGEAWWIGTFLVCVAGALCMILTWVRTYRGGRWWPWPPATEVIMVGWMVPQSWLA